MVERAHIRSIIGATINRYLPDSLSQRSYSDSSDDLNCITQDFI